MLDQTLLFSCDSLIFLQSWGLGLVKARFFLVPGLTFAKKAKQKHKKTGVFDQASAVFGLMAQQK